MTEPGQWLEGLDAPRPLSDELRGRLTQQLQSTGSRPLDQSLSARLTDRLADPVADLLAGLDAPRALSTDLRSRLIHALPSRSWDRSRLVLWGSAAAAVVAVLLVLQSPGDGPVTGNVDGHRAVNASPQPTQTSGTVAGGPIQGPGGDAVAPLDSSPVVSAPQQEPATGYVGGSGPEQDSYGYYSWPYAAMPAARPPGGDSSSHEPEPTQEPTPAVTSRTPDVGPLAGGTTVRITGRLLRTATRITFGDAAGTGLKVLDDQHLSVVSPPHAAGRVSFVVHFSDGGQYVVYSGFTYLKVPRIDALAPDRGPMGGGTWVDITGDALSHATVVTFGGTAATRIDVVSDTHLRALSPTHELGPADVTVTTPGGTSNALRYLFLI